ncbi:Pro-epidermal growth factor [Dirofilaria immitis]
MFFSIRNYHIVLYVIVRNRHHTTVTGIKCYCRYHTILLSATGITLLQQASMLQSAISIILCYCPQPTSHYCNRHKMLLSATGITLLQQASMLQSAISIILCYCPQPTSHYCNRHKMLLSTTGIICYCPKPALYYCNRHHIVLLSAESVHMFATSYWLCRTSHHLSKYLLKILKN